jgi:hypothetical protein
VWNKPRGINFIKIITIGGGAGGGGGHSSATTNARGGGGGGSSSVVTTVMLPAIFLPDRLYISSGVGSVGGSGGGGSSNRGIQSYVSITPSTAAIYVVCYSFGTANTTAGGTAPTEVARQLKDLTAKNSQSAKLISSRAAAFSGMMSA